MNNVATPTISSNLREGNGSRPQHYVEFIFRLTGDQVASFTCNPARLNDRSYSTADAPAYLTPVYFDKAVLDKYEALPRDYSISDSLLSCQTHWGLMIDAPASSRTVCVWLGDLGLDLPYEEQLHWRRFNVLPND